MPYGSSTYGTAVYGGGALSIPPITNRPEVTQAAEDLYEILKPLAYLDEFLGWPLLIMCEALANPLQEVNDYVGPDGDISWSSILDVDTAPYEALPWLAQLVGLDAPKILVGETLPQHENRIRNYIRATPGFYRGSRGAITAAAQQFLLGTKAVYFHERDAGAYHITVNTRTTETPDAAKVLAALLSQKPAGITLVHNIIAGQDWQEVINENATWTVVLSTYTSIDDLEEG